MPITPFARLFPRSSIPGLLALLALAGLLAACANPISPDLRRQADQDIAPGEFLNSPERFVGRLIILSGVIVGTTVVQDGTLLEILQTPASGSGRPTNYDKSQGRFFALNRGATLDPAIWATGREVTVAGDVLGTRETTLGEQKRAYPLIGVRQIHLWEPRARGYDDRYYDPYYDPYYGPWLGGFGWRGSGGGGVGFGVGSRL